MRKNRKEKAAGLTRRQALTCAAATFGFGLATSTGRTAKTVASQQRRRRPREREGSTTKHSSLKPMEKGRCGSLVQQETRGPAGVTYCMLPQGYDGGEQFWLTRAKGGQALRSRPAPSPAQGGWQRELLEAPAVPAPDADRHDCRRRLGCRPCRSRGGQGDRARHHRRGYRHGREGRQRRRYPHLRQ